MSEHLQDFLCITAGQRSGSTALRSLIAGSGRFQDFGELFDTSTIDQPASFYGFCRERKVLLSDILSGPDAENLVREYIAVLRKLAGKKHLLFDVKFNSWGEIRMPWTFLHQEPFFLRQLKWRDARFLFLWRRNLVEQVLSDRVSDHIGKWHNLEAADVKEPFRLDVERISTRAMLLCQSESYFFENLRSYPKTLFLCYEDMFDAGGNLNPEIESKVSGLLGQPLNLPRTGYFFRNRIDKSKVVSNYGELSSAIHRIEAVYRNPAFRQAVRA